MPARDDVTLAAQILRQVLFHLCGAIKGHWVKPFVKIGEQTKPITLDYPGTFDAAFVISEAFLGF